MPPPMPPARAATLLPPPPPLPSEFWFSPVAEDAAAASVVEDGDVLVGSVGFSVEDVDDVSDAVEEDTTSGSVRLT